MKVGERTRSHQRPGLLAALLLGLGLGLGACGQPAPPSDDGAEQGTALTAAADQTYSYLLPLFELGTTRAPARNLFLHRLGLADAADREVTTPNNDTL